MEKEVTIQLMYRFTDFYNLDRVKGHVLLDSIHVYELVNKYELSKEVEFKIQNGVLSVDNQKRNKDYLLILHTLCETEVLMNSNSEFSFYVYPECAKSLRYKPQTRTSNGINVPRVCKLCKRTFFEGSERSC